MKAVFAIPIFCLIIFSSSVSGQNSSERVTVVGDSLKGKIVNGENIREIFGNVIITQGEVKITCDRAVQYLRKNEVELFGDVEVLQDTVRLLTDAGYYYGNEKIAYSDTGLIMHDGHMILAAMNGFYYMEEEKAYLYENVKLVDKFSTLISDELTYYQSEDNIYCTLLQRKVPRKHLSCELSSQAEDCHEELNRFAENDIRIDYIRSPIAVSVICNNSFC